MYGEQEKKVTGREQKATSDMAEAVQKCKGSPITDIAEAVQKCKESPITDIADPVRYESKAFVNSAFVEITTGGRFDVQMQYPPLGMKHAEPQCYVRKEVYEMLLQAAERLPNGYRFRIWDTWRPFALQKELYEVYSQDIIRDFNLADCTEEERKAVIRKFVSDPVADRDVPPVHTTGGAVDLTILDENGRELPMGTAFDAFTDKTNTAYYEKISLGGDEGSGVNGESDGNDRGKADDRNGRDDREIRENRRLLYHIMTEAGFTNLPSEWWHFDYGDRFWGYYKGKPAIYRGVFTREEIHGDGQQGKTGN
ncbi:MAG: M15 family metallopeptidase [Lachnospiraceae bacterium]|nr:M15 family metallopeptidase [Lachnospiraceae bacterium]